MSTVKRLLAATAAALFILTASAGVAAADADPGMTHNSVSPDMTFN